LGRPRWAEFIHCVGHVRQKADAARAIVLDVCWPERRHAIQKIERHLNGFIGHRFTFRALGKFL
jgi:hypothetical protein